MQSVKRPAETPNDSGSRKRATIRFPLGRFILGQSSVLMAMKYEDSDVIFHSLEFDAKFKLRVIHTGDGKFRIPRLPNSMPFSKPLTLDDVHPWRNQLKRGQYVMLWIEGMRCLGIVAQREGSFVTIHAVGSGMRFKRHIHALSLSMPSLEQLMSEIIPMEKPFSPYLGAFCTHRDSRNTCTVVDVDVRYSMILIQQTHIYPETLSPDTFNHTWLTMEEFLLDYEVEYMIERKDDCKEIGTFEVPVKDKLPLIQHYFDTHDENLLCRELFSARTISDASVNDLMYHSSYHYMYPCFEVVAIRQMTSNSGEFHNVLERIMRQKVVKVACNTTDKIDILLLTQELLEEKGYEYARGLMLRQKLNRHRVITIKPVSMEGNIILFKAFYHGIPSIHIQKPYKRRSINTLFQCFMRNYMNKKPHVIPVREYQLQPVLKNYDGTLPLLKYQRLAVSHMLHRETNEPRFLSHAFEQEVNGMVYSMVTGPHEDYISEATGGILAMDVGLGKTVCTIALYEKRPVKTLIVSPMTLLDQWRNEIHQFLPECKVTDVYGRKRDQSGEIVLTTYGIVRSMFSKNEAFTGFERVVFDESHSVKSISSVSCRACSAIYAPSRWCLTATPHPADSYNELIPQMCMLNCHSFRFYNKMTIDSSNMAILDHITKIMRNRIILRYRRFRIKSLKMKCHQTKIVKKQHLVEQNEQEKTLFDALYAVCSEHARRSEKRNYLHVKNILDRLLLCGVSPTLVPLRAFAERVMSDEMMTNSSEQIKNRLGKSNFHKEVKDQLDALDSLQCCICMDTIQRPTITPCNHIYCNECIVQQLNHRNKCPMCRSVIQKDTLVEIDETTQVEENEDEVMFHDLLGHRCKVDRKIYDLYQSHPKSSKLEYLRKLISDAGDESVIVFSQFKNVLSALKKEYPEACMITGATTRVRRKKAIEQFQKKEKKIFLLSLHCASVGVTLTSGSHMVFMEPVLSSSIREQAMGRINRMGQNKRIHVHTLVNERTDKKMLSWDINDKKKFVGDVLRYLYY